VEKRICVHCGSDKTYSVIRGNCAIHYQWYNIDGWFCSKCYSRLFNSPKWRPINNKKRIHFKGKTVFLKENPRKGVCTWCGKKKGEPFINNRNKLRYVKTTIHHIEYHDDDPLKDTIELCSSCHAKEGVRLGQLTGIIRRSNF